MKYLKTFDDYDKYKEFVGELDNKDKPYLSDDETFTVFWGFGKKNYWGIYQTSLSPIYDGYLIKSNDSITGFIDLIKSKVYWLEGVQDIPQDIDEFEYIDYLHNQKKVAWEKLKDLT